MQPLISQLTSYFSAQSINSLENNGLYSFSGFEQGFSGVYENLLGGDYAANIAAVDGQALPQSAYSPISIQITQLTLKTAAPTVEGNVDSQVDLPTTSNTQSSLLSPEQYILPANQNSTLANRSTSITSTSLNDSPSANANISTEVNSPQKQSPLSNQLGEAVAYRNLPSTSASDNQLSSDDLQALSKSYINSQSDSESVSLNKQTANTSQSNIELARYSSTTQQANQYNVEVGKQANVIENNSTSIDSETLIQRQVPANLASSSSSQVETRTGNIGIAVDPSVDDVSAATAKQDQTVRLFNNQEHAVQHVDEKITRSNNVETNSEKVNNANIQSVLSNKELNTNISSIKVEETLDKQAVYQTPIYNERKAQEPVNTNRPVVSYQNTAQEIVVNDKSAFSNQLSQQGDFSLESKLDSNIVTNKLQEFSPEIKSLSNQYVGEKPQLSNYISDSSAIGNKTTLLDRVGLTASTVTSEVNNTEEVAQQITWAKHNNANHVKIALAPEHLGALEISIDQDVDGLNIQFTTQNAQAKDAIEAFMPRLKDMLEQQGLNLQNADVSQQGNQQNSADYSETMQQNNLDVIASDEDGKQANIQNLASADIATNSRLLEEFA